MQSRQSLDELIETLRKIGPLVSLLQGESGDPDSRRKLLQTAMEMTVKVTLSGELGALEKTSDEVMEIVDPLRRAGKAFAELSQNSLGLLALHYRAPWLDDGRFTLAGTCPQRLGPILESAFERVGKKPVGCWQQKDPLGNIFHRELLDRYRRIYSRPFSFNDRIFQVVSSSKPGSRLHTAPSIWTVDFGATPEKPVLVVNEQATGSIKTRGSLNISKALLRQLTRGEEGDLRFAILRSAFDDSAHRSERGSGKISAALSNAVEMTWHRILAQKGSYPRWENCLTTLRFLKDDPSSVFWTPQTRDALIEALCFIQGITLYQFFAPGGLTTVTAPGLQGDEEALGAMTIGALSRECVDSLVEALAGAAIEVLHDLYSAAKQAPEEFEFRKEPNLENILGDVALASFLRQEIQGISGAESLLAEALSLSAKVCHQLHEQRRLHFRFLLGNAVDLAQFREVFVFEGDDQIHFSGWDSEKRALCLKAHYSHLQEPGLGIFFEWGRRVHFRVIETVSVRRVLDLPVGPVVKRDEDPHSIRVSTALRLTSEIPNLAVIDTGDGKIRLYLRGRLSLTWQADLGWRSPLLEPGWISRESLPDELTGASAHLGYQLSRERVLALSDALLWIADAPGVGCTLVLTSDFEELKNRHLVELNPRKLEWIEEVALLGCECRNIRNLLMQDGATILNLNQGYLTGQQQLIAFNPKDGRAVEPDPGDEERWTYGTRRASACDLTKVFPECVTITVSSDGPINVFHHGRRKLPHERFA